MGTCNRAVRVTVAVPIPVQPRVDLPITYPDNNTHPTSFALN